MDLSLQQRCKKKEKANMEFAFSFCIFFFFSDHTFPNEPYGSDDMKKERSSASLFAISFVISLAALLIVIMLVLSATMLSPDRLSAASEQQSSSSDLSLAYYRPMQEEAFSLLLIQCRERNEAPYRYTLVYFDPVNAAITLIKIPPETESTIGTRTDTLNGQYDYAGSDNAKMGVGSVLLNEVDCYARIDQSGRVNLIDALGGMEKTLSFAYEKGDVSLPVGKNLLDGKTVSRILEQTPNSIFSSEEEFLKEFLEQRLTPELADKGDYLFNVFLNNTDTDVTQFGYAEHKKAIRYFLNQQQRQVKLRELTGSWSDDRSVFYPDAASIREINQIISKT